MSAPLSEAPVRLHLGNSTFHFITGCDDFLICDTLFLLSFIICCHLTKGISNCHTGLNQQGKLHEQPRIVHHQLFISFRSGFLFLPGSYNNHRQSRCNGHSRQKVTGVVIGCFPFQLFAIPVVWKIIIIWIFQFAVIAFHIFQKLLLSFLICGQLLRFPGFFLFQFFFRNLYVYAACFFSFHGYHKFFFIGVFLLFQFITVLQ